MKSRRGCASTGENLTPNHVAVHTSRRSMKQNFACSGDGPACVNAMWSRVSDSNIRAVAGAVVWRRRPIGSCSFPTPRRRLSKGRVCSWRVAQDCWAWRISSDGIDLGRGASRSTDRADPARALATNDVGDGGPGGQVLKAVVWRLILRARSAASLPLLLFPGGPSPGAVVPRVSHPCSARGDPHGDRRSHGHVGGCGSTRRPSR